MITRSAWGETSPGCSFFISIQLWDVEPQNLGEVSPSEATYYFYEFQSLFHELCLSNYFQHVFCSEIGPRQQTKNPTPFKSFGLLNRVMTQMNTYSIEKILNLRTRQNNFGMFRDRKTMQVFQCESPKGSNWHLALSVCDAIALEAFTRFHKSMEQLIVKLVTKGIRRLRRWRIMTTSHLNKWKHDVTFWRKTS